MVAAAPVTGVATLVVGVDVAAPVAVVDPPPDGWDALQKLWSPSVRLAITVASLFNVCVCVCLCYLQNLVSSKRLISTVTGLFSYL